MQKKTRPYLPLPLLHRDLRLWDGYHDNSSAASARMETDSRTAETWQPGCLCSARAKAYHSPERASSAPMARAFAHSVSVSACRFASLPSVFVSTSVNCWTRTKRCAAGETRRVGAFLLARRFTCQPVRQTVCLSVSGSAGWPAAAGGNRFLAGSRRTMCLRRRRVGEGLGGERYGLILSSPYLKGPATSQR